MFDRIAEDIKKAMLAKDKPRLLVLRSMKTDLMNRKIELITDKLTDEEALLVLHRAVKAREQAIEMFQQGNRTDLVENGRREIKIIQEYLPRNFTPEEIEKIVDEVFETEKPEGMKDMGKVMKAVLDRTGTRADGKIVSSIVRQKLNS